MIVELVCKVLSFKFILLLIINKICDFIYYFIIILIILQNYNELNLITLKG